MKICYLTNNIDPKNGWGRYASDLIYGVKNAGNNVVVLKEADDGLDGFPILSRGAGMIASALRIRKFVIDCDIVHVLDSYPYGIIALLSNLGLKKKIVITGVGTYAVAPLYHWKISFLLKWAYRRSDCVVAISRFTAGEIEKKTNLKEITVINPGISFKKFYKPRASSNEKFILSVGTLKRRKGYHISIPAFALAQKKIPNLKYKIVCGPNDLDYFPLPKLIAQQHGVEKDVEFLNTLNDRELADLYSQAYLFILASVNNNHSFEGFGMVFLEAAAAGLPVIGTFGNGIEDAVDNGQNGMLVSQNNVEKTAEAIVQLASDQNKWHKMSEASYKWAEAHDNKFMIEKYLNLYKGLYEQKRQDHKFDQRF